MTLKSVNHWGWIALVLGWCFWLIFFDKPSSPSVSPAFKTVFLNFEDPKKDVPRFYRLATVALDAYGFSQPGDPSSADAVIDISTKDNGEKEDNPIHVTTLQADFRLSGGELYRQDSCVGIMPGAPDSGIRVTRVPLQLKKDQPSVTRVFVGDAQTDEDPALLALVGKELEQNGFQLVADKTQAQAVLTKLKAYRHVIHIVGKRQTLTMNLYSPKGKKDFGMQRYIKMLTETAVIDLEPKRTRPCSIYLDPYLAVTAPQSDEEFLRRIISALKYIDERNHSSH